MRLLHWMPYLRSPSCDQWRPQELQCFEIEDCNMTTGRKQASTHP